MQRRELAKAERQRLVASLVARKRIATQFELCDALAAEGCAVTQATVSRDIHELGLVKAHDALGRARYVAPPERSRRDDPQEGLRRVLSEFGRSATPAQNIVVVQSELGSAPAIARALDRVQHPRIVGTLAGDDTCLVITAGAADAKTLAEELRAALA
jgi:transcriptional regulator of arginine metabolism